ncbi:MAG: ABC transporter ATP-binding protein [Proteobacteria bacterium]|nr:ABC transporter ATP-binding protein [Pseudomonadota bacterium]
MTGLLIEDVQHAYDDTTVLRGVSLSVGAGEIVCLLGPSGCGKTTLLRIAAGLERLQSGHVSVGGVTVADGTRFLMPEQRGVGFMFQDYALFPHLTIQQNIEFGLDGLAPSAKEKRVKEVLEQVDLVGYGAGYPHLLSGGQQQRVALARALAPEPGVLLLDEPFSGLDETLRGQVREEILVILKDTGVATLMVTHNPEEAMFMADRMMVMGPGGTILQSGGPSDVYTQPTDEFVASFFGQINKLTGTVENGAVESLLGSIATPELENGLPVSIIIRADGIEISPDGSAGRAITVTSARPLGRSTFVRFSVVGEESDGSELRCRLPGLHADLVGQTMFASVIDGHAFVFPKSGKA